MDERRFDAMARLVAQKHPRRAALIATVIAVLAAQPAVTDAAKSRGAKRGQRRGKDKRARHGKRRDRARNRDRVTAEATCANPGPSSNLKNCNFRDREFIDVDLSSSNLRNADFRGAVLRCADLSSSQLKGVRFQNADLTLADLHSSGCQGTVFNAGTTFCRTIMCDGSVNNADCPGPGPEPTCCPDGGTLCDGTCIDTGTDPDNCGACGLECTQGQSCQGGACGVACGSDFCPAATEICDDGVCRGCDVCATGCDFTTLQPAINAAAANDVIRICAGAYGRFQGGPVADIDESLTLRGAGKGLGGTRLDGGGQPNLFDAVVKVGFGITVHLQHLVVTGGIGGGGIDNFRLIDSATLILDGVLVTGNTASGSCAGINNNDGHVILNAGAAVTGNEANNFGGGICNFSGTLTLNAGSSVTNNRAGSSPGGIFNLEGTVTLNPGSDVSGNIPDNCSGC